MDEAQNVSIPRYRARLARRQAHHAEGRHHQAREPASARHSFATHLIENGADLPTVQPLLGHADLRATSIYLHLSQRHLKAAGTPLDKIEVKPPDQVKRSRKLHKR